MRKMRVFEALLKWEMQGKYKSNAWCEGSVIVEINSSEVYRATIVAEINYSKVYRAIA